MSLESLRQLRRDHHRRPDGVVLVLVGRKPAWKGDAPNFVHVRPDADVIGIDWRPLIGLWVALIVAPGERWLAARVLDAVHAAGARIYGAVDEAGAHLCITESTAKHERNLRATWEQLCR